MAKRRVTDIARERGLDPNEVARRLFEAGVPIQRDMVDEVAAARALAGSRPTASAKNGQKRRPGAPPARPQTEHAHRGAPGPRAERAPAGDRHTAARAAGRDPAAARP